ncbi:hypothetical protein AAFF_G00417390, partial [Aldrovandia affinis]
MRGKSSLADLGDSVILLRCCICQFASTLDSNAGSTQTGVYDGWTDLGDSGRPEKEHFEKFTLYLNKVELEGCRPIPQGRLEDQTRPGVVTLMEGYYGDKMVNITHEILKNIPRIDLIEKYGLEKSVESRGGQTVRKRMHSSSSGAAGSDVSPERKRRVMEPGSETEQEGRPSRSKAASPLSSSHQGPDTGNSKLAQRIKVKQKLSLEDKYKDTPEGFEDSGERNPLNNIYTEVNIIEGDSKGVNNEHEVRQIETASRKQRKRDTHIKCNNIFKPLPGQTITIRKVLMKGIAGIGKTISVQKFVLDWATGGANQDVDFMFVLPFRELNLIKGEYSLLGLLQEFHPETE